MTVMYLSTKYMAEMYLRTKYMAEMYFSTKYMTEMFFSANCYAFNSAVRVFTFHHLMYLNTPNSI